jgi:hypothetical protein
MGTEPVLARCIRETRCPQCLAGAGKPCIDTATGRHVEMHGLRLRAYRAKIGRKEFLRRHRSPS